MAIEKGLYAAPQGMEEEEAPDLEIEIVDPEMVTLDDGSVEITIIPNAEPTDMLPFDANLAEVLEDSVLSFSNDSIISSISDFFFFLSGIVFIFSFNFHWFWFIHIG